MKRLRFNDGLCNEESFSETDEGFDSYRSEVIRRWIISKLEIYEIKDNDLMGKA